MNFQDVIRRIIKKYPPSILYKDITYGRYENEYKDSLFNDIWLTVESVRETDYIGVCSQMAFILLFTILPTLLFIILICDQFVPNFQNDFFYFLQVILPKAGYDYLYSELNNLLSYLNRIEIFLFISSAVFGTLSAHTIISGLNKTYGYKPYKSKKWEWIKSFFMLFLLALILVFLTYFFLTSIGITKRIIETGNYSIGDEMLDTTFTSIVGVSGLFLILLLTYMFSPERHITVREALPGAIVSTFGIIILFRIYLYILNRSKNYLTIYGSLSGLFILLTAFYFLCYILNFGAKFNVFISFRTFKNRYGKMEKTD